MSLDLILKRTDRLIQHIEAYYKSNDVGRCMVNQIYVATWEWCEFSLKLFHIWAYMLLGCFIGFWCLLLIGKLLRNFVLSSSNNGNGSTTIISSYHGQQTTCQPTNEPWWKTLLLQINMLLSFPTFSQVWSLGIFLMIFFYGGQTGKTLLLIYYIHLFTDQSPRHFGWDEDVSWIMCVLGGSGQRSTRNDDDKETKSQQSSPSSTWWWTRLFHMGFPFRHVCRNAYNFRLVKEYFNSELIKTSDDNLCPSKNYLFLYHPHGIMAIGASSTLSTDVAGFPELFPGIHRSTCVLNACFLIPFFRDWMLANGFVSANRSTMMKHLTTSQRSLILMPGGSAEALHAHPGIFRVYLKNRKGFIKIALETGCSLVPCLGFGENEVYETLYTHDNDIGSNGNDRQKKEGSLDKTKIREEHEKENARKNIRTFEQNGISSKGTNSKSPKRTKNHNMKHRQTSKTTSSSSTTSKNNNNNNMAQLLYTLFVEGQYKKLFFTCQRQLAKWLTFSVPILTHVLPKRTKITVVVGEPIDFSTMNDGGRTTKMDPKLVDECHELYCQKLKELYDKHKSKYGIPGVELEIV